MLGMWTRADDVLKTGGLLDFLRGRGRVACTVLTASGLMLCVGWPQVGVLRASM